MNPFGKKFIDDTAPIFMPVSSTCFLTSKKLKMGCESVPLLL